MVDGVTGIALAVTAVAAAAEAMRRILRWLFREWRMVADHIEHQQQVNNVVVQELMPNCGSSLVDRVRVVEQSVGGLVEYVREVEQRRAERKRTDTT